MLLELIQENSRMKTFSHPATKISLATHYGKYPIRSLIKCNTLNQCKHSWLNLNDMCAGWKIIVPEYSNNPVCPCSISSTPNILVLRDEIKLNVN